MILVAGEVDIDPAQREEAIAAAREVAVATRSEPGCISYSFSADLEDEGRFRVFEQWESEEALAAHFQTPHLQAFRAKFASFGVRAMRIRKYEAKDIGPA